MDLKRQFELEVQAFKAIQTEIQKCMQTQQQLVQQENENSMVLQELGRLDDDSEVFKLIGPALIKQDPVEARSNVQKRLAYIKGELARLEGQMKGLEAKGQEKQAVLMKMQKQVAAMAQGQDGQPIAA